MPVFLSRARAAVELMRPRHWVKNGFVLTGLLFGHAWNDAMVLHAVLGATAAFCLASSAVSRMCRTSSAGSGPPARSAFSSRGIRTSST